MPTTNYLAFGVIGFYALMLLVPTSAIAQRSNFTAYSGAQMTQNVSITYCNNTTTIGPFTAFNKIGGCPVKVLFESPNSVQLQYADGNGYDGYVIQLESAYHWYEISHQDSGYTTTIVLEPLR